MRIVAALAWIGGGLRGLRSPPVLLAAVALVLVTALPSYDSTPQTGFMSDDDEIADVTGWTPADAMDIPLSARLARAMLARAGYIEPLRTLPWTDDTTDPMAFMAVGGHSDFRCARAGQVPPTNGGTRSSNNGQGIDVAALTLSIVAAEQYNRGDLRRTLEFLFFDLARMISVDADFSLGIAQIRPSQLRRISDQILPGVVLDDDKVVAILSDRCQSIGYAALLVSSLVSARPASAETGRTAVIRDVAMAYSGATETARRHVVRYVSVVTSAYALLTEHSDALFDRRADSDPSLWRATSCLAFSPDSRDRRLVGTTLAKALGLTTEFASWLGLRSAAVAGGTVSAELSPEALIRLATRTDDRFWVFNAYRAPQTFPRTLQRPLDAQRRQIFHDWLEGFGVPPERIIAVDDPDLVDRGCPMAAGQPAPMIAFVVGRTAAYPGRGSSP